jgi:hypothetical protein
MDAANKFSMTSHSKLGGILKSNHYILNDLLNMECTLCISISSKLDPSIRWDDNTMSSAKLHLPSPFFTPQFPAISSLIYALLSNANYNPM